MYKFNYIIMCLYVYIPALQWTPCPKDLPRPWAMLPLNKAKPVISTGIPNMPVKDEGLRV